MRTTLCILGVALATTFVIAVGATTMRYTTVIKEVSLLFHEQIMVVDKNAIVIQAIPIGRSMLPQNSTLRELQKVAGVEKTVPVLFVIDVIVEQELRPVPANFTIGIPVGDWNLILGPTPLRGNEGHLPISEESNEAIVGVSLSEQFGWAEGTRLNINGHEVAISGILDTKLALLSRSIVMPLALAQDAYNYQGSVNVIAVKPAEEYSQESLAGAIRQSVSYVSALTEDERVDVIQPVLAQVETWNLGIETVVFLISLILVMTVMIMSVSERRRDFATLDAMGAPLSFVFRVVTFEAALVGVLGGVVGIVLGSLSSIVLASLYSSIPLTLFFPSVFEVVPPMFMFEIFATAVTVCIIGGIIPAVNATRMRIAEILRAEY